MRIGSGLEKAYVWGEDEAMTRLERLVEMVRELSPEEFDTFAASVDDLRAERWDRQIEDDSAKGNLDALIEGALVSHSAARTRPL